jgi:ketosteroid isomerase-like protein
MTAEVLLGVGLGAFMTVSALHRLLSPTLTARPVRTRTRGLAAAEAVKDVESALGYWTRDAILQMTGSPRVQGRDAIRSAYARYFGAVLRTSSLTRSVTVLGGGSALECGTNHLMWPSQGGEVRDVVDYMAVWRKVRGSWYLAALSMTRVASEMIPLPTGSQEHEAAQQGDEADKA